MSKDSGANWRLDSRTRIEFEEFHFFLDFVHFLVNAKLYILVDIDTISSWENIGATRSGVKENKFLDFLVKIRTDDAAAEKEIKNGRKRKDFNFLFSLFRSFVLLMLIEERLTICTMEGSTNSIGKFWHFWPNFIHLKSFIVVYLSSIRESLTLLFADVLHVSFFPLEEIADRRWLRRRLPFGRSLTMCWWHLRIKQKKRNNKKISFAILESPGTHSTNEAIEGERERKKQKQQLLTFCRSNLIVWWTSVYCRNFSSCFLHLNFFPLLLFIFNIMEKSWIVGNRKAT